MSFSEADHPRSRGRFAPKAHAEAAPLDLDSDASVATAVDLLEAAAADDCALDDLVIDCARANAQDRYSNDPALAGLDDDEALDQVDDDAGHEASEVNNGGFEAQVRYLRSQLGADEMLRQVYDVVGLARSA